MKIKFLLFIFLFFSLSLIALADGNNVSDVKGYVREIKTGEPLPFANVLLLNKSQGTSTNTDGYFVLVNVPVGVCSLQVQYIGYKTKNIVLENKAKAGAPLIIEMEPAVIKMKGVTVFAEPEMLDVSSAQVSQMTISPRQISSLPNIGEIDVFRTMQLLPGISGANEGESGLYIRGGTPDQNLILFDGMTIYHVDHFFGFFSAFNADAVKDIQIFKGGYPAKYGGRLSSVVDLTGKTGNRNRREFGYGINLLSAHAYFETPLWDKGAFLIAGRRSYTDFVRSPLYDSIYKLMTGDENSGAVGGAVRGGGRFGNMKQANFQPSFYFYDLNSKLTFGPTEKDVITFSFYSGKDDLDQSQDFSELGMRMRDTGAEATLSTINYTQWGNIGYSGKWSRQWHNRLHVDVLVAHSNYFSQYDQSSKLEGVTPIQTDSSFFRRSFNSASREENEVFDTSYKIDFDWQLSATNDMSFGVQLSNFDNEFESFRNDSILIFSRSTKAQMRSFYLQNTWKKNPLKLTLGLRTSHYDKTNKFYNEPRASMTFNLTKKLKLKGAWGYYYQFVNRIANEDVTQGARDFWLLADEDFNPGFAEHRIIGLNYENQQYLFSIEGYQKNLEDLIEFSRRYVFSGSSLPSKRYMPVDNFFIGTGDARGIEFLLQKKRGDLTGWLGYTISKVDYTFPAINDGQTFPANHDRRNEINVVARYQIGVWSLSATWVFASGNPYTFPESQYYITLLDGTRQSYIHVSDKNADRLPDYHRLDISGSRKWSTESWETEVGISIFNVYNHKNIWYKEYNLDTVPVTVTDINLLGFTPTIYIQMKLK